MFFLLETAPLFHSLAAPNPGSYRCGDFLVCLERLTWTFFPKVSPLGDVTDWSSVPSGRMLPIDTGYFDIITGTIVPCLTNRHMFLGSLNDDLSVLIPS